jgi:NAD(P)-dependent dehydrogenase (short-subunit alcohol dehydrogenase family)
VVVTGGGSGIGAALVAAFARQGSQVVFVDIAESDSRALARELGAFGVRVVCVVPGAVRTPRQSRLWLTPEIEADILASQCIRARVDPADIAAMVLFLASDNAPHVHGS